MTRLQANQQILALLATYFERYPDLRFGQGLSNLGIATHIKYYTKNELDVLEGRFEDIFFTESSKTLADISPSEVLLDQELNMSLIDV